MLPLLSFGERIVDAVAQPLVTAGPHDQFWLGIGQLVAAGLLGTTLSLAALWAIRQARN